LILTVGEAVTSLSYLVGAAVFLWAARRRRLATEGIAWVAATGFVAGIVGAKLTQLLFQGWPLTITPAAALDPRAGGRALAGGLIFGWLGVEMAKRKLGIRRSTGDLFALALPAGEAVGRIGCYLNGCCYGKACDLPWAVWQHGELRHPAQLYSAFSSLLLFVFLVWAEGKLTQEGALFRLYLVGFALTRFILEYFRASDSLVFGLTPMQWLCLEIFIAVVGMEMWKRRSKLVRHG